MLFGCLECCFLLARLALVVVAYSLDVKDFIALVGKYLSPVAFGPCVDGLPDLVLHFCLPQADRLSCRLVFAIAILLPKKTHRSHTDCLPLD